MREEVHKYDYFEMDESVDRNVSKENKQRNSGPHKKSNSAGFSNQPFSLHLEVYEDDSLSDTSSDCLQIVTSDNEIGEDKIRNRKRRHSQLEENEIEEFTSLEAQIDRQLDAKAAKTNLSVTNVKNILKHVITNKRVIEMVRHTLRESEAADRDSDDEDCSFEPKLTRAKTKELLKSQPAITWPITPAKNYASECQVLIEQELPEDSSDEEYQPNEEEQSEEEKEMSASDMESPAVVPQSVAHEPECPQPSTPASNDSSTQTSWTEDGLFRVPQEHIGQRTRSKLCLSDTPLETIEQAFIPPDITTDMYDSECDDEDWKNFLKDFMKPLTPELNEAVDDDDADPEYNIVGDEEEVDKDELLADVTVEVSRKELDDLVAELFEASSDEDELEPLEAVFIPESAAEVGVQDDCSEALMQMLAEQKLLIGQQMRKHVQLTTQHFLQCYLHPEFSQWAPKCKEMLVCLKCLAGNRTNSAFLAENLEAAIKLVEDWEERWSSNAEEEEEYVRFLQEESKRGSIKNSNRKINKQYFPKQFLEVVSSSEVFLYPLMLPARPFRVGEFKPVFLPAEEQLAAIGLEQFESYLKETKENFKDLIKVVSLIVKYMMPGKDVLKLYDIIRRKRFVKSSPIHYYFRHNCAPAAEHFVIPYNSTMARAPNKQPIELLPDVWKEAIYHEKASVSMWYVCE
ncbi:GON-4-like protein isoform X2 [Bacillus rossius redtenbacheri]|uniref:GON-4-like protein isoform X2 n=1 Tax=Bacillus rossius redtenbacheri TaxID=93214 RepID=UPI002FDDB269